MIPECLAVGAIVFPVVFEAGQVHGRGNDITERESRHLEHRLYIEDGLMRLPGYVPFSNELTVRTLGDLACDEDPPAYLRAMGVRRCRGGE
jgi:hypothetical protein